MLEQIINITPGSDFKKTRNTKGFVRIKNKGSFNKLVFNDTFVFSPAAQYLSKLNWQLKEIHVFPNEKVFLSFVTSNFEFHITLDLSKVSYLDYINYTVICEREYGFKLRKLLLNLSVGIEEILYSEKIMPIEFGSLETLIGRMLPFTVDNELVKMREAELFRFVEGLEEGLKEEFGYLNVLLFTLIYKITNITYTLVNEDKNPENPLIKIEKVISFSGD
jgi:hypothetical protein